MTWNTLTNLADQQVVTEEHMDDIRENIEHLGSLKGWGVPFSTLSGSDETSGVTGTYTGDGTSSQAVNVGFQPKMVIVWPKTSGGFAIATNQDTVGSAKTDAGLYSANLINALTATGFTAGSSFNTNATVYVYVAYGAG